MADDAIQFATNDLIDYTGDPEEGTTLGTLLGRNLLTGLILSLLVAALLGAFSGAATGLFDQQALDLAGVVILLVKAILPTALTCLILMLGSVAFTAWGRQRLNKDKDLSNVAMTLVLMIVGILIQLGLSYLVMVIL